jgi:hypothetical protein
LSSDFLSGNANMIVFCIWQKNIGWFCIRNRRRRTLTDEWIHKHYYCYALVSWLILA